MADANSTGGESSSAASTITMSTHMGMNLPTDKTEVMQMLMDATKALGLKKPEPSKLSKYFRERVPQRAFVDVFLFVQKTTGFAAGLFEDRPELLGKGSDDKRELLTRIAVCVDVFQKRPLGSWDIGLIKNSGSSSATPEGVLVALRLLLAAVLAGQECMAGGGDTAERNKDAVAKGVDRSLIATPESTVASEEKKKKKKKKKKMKKDDEGDEEEAQEAELAAATAAATAANARVGGRDQAADAPPPDTAAVEDSAAADVTEHTAPEQAVRPGAATEDPAAQKQEGAVGGDEATVASSLTAPSQYVEPPSAEPTSTEPASTEPASTEPAPAEPAVEPATAELAAAEPSPAVVRPAPTHEDFLYAKLTLVATCKGSVNMTIGYVRKALGNTNEKLLRSERLFSALPFNFVHGIFSAIVEVTGFGEGLFEDSEMTARKLKSAEARKQYLDKLEGLVWKALELGSIQKIETANLWVRMLTEDQQIEVRRLMQYFAIAAVSVPPSKAAECVEAVLRGGGEVEDDQKSQDADDDASMMSHGSSLSAATTVTGDGHLHGAYAGDEEPESLAEAVDTTIRVLGGILGESSKLLKKRTILEKPPVTFVHDVFTAVRVSTTFAAGLFADKPELDFKEGVKNSMGDTDVQRFESRKLFCIRLILCVANFHAQPIDFVDHHSIMYGHDEVDVNRLLTALGRAGEVCRAGGASAAERNAYAVKNAIAGVYDPPAPSPTTLEPASSPVATATLAATAALAGGRSAGEETTKSMSMVSMRAASRLLSSSKKKAPPASAPSGVAFSVEVSATIPDLDVADFDEQQQQLFIDTAVKALGIDLKSGATVIIESISAGSVVVKFKVLGLGDDDAAVAVGEKMKSALPTAFEEIGFGQVTMSAPLKGLAMVNPSKATKLHPEKEEEQEDATVGTPYTKDSRGGSTYTDAFDTYVTRRSDAYTLAYDSYFTRLSPEEQQWDTVRDTRLLHTEFFWIDDAESLAADGTLTMLKELARNFGGPVPFPGAKRDTSGRELFMMDVVAQFEPYGVGCGGGREYVARVLEEGIDDALNDGLFDVDNEPDDYYEDDFGAASVMDSSTVGGRQNYPRPLRGSAHPTHSLVVVASTIQALRRFFKSPERKMFDRLIEPRLAAPPVEPGPVESRPPEPAPSREEYSQSLQLESFSGTEFSAVKMTEDAGEVEKRFTSPKKPVGTTVTSGLVPSVPTSLPPSVWSPSKSRRITPILTQPIDSTRPVFDMMAKLCEPEPEPEVNPALAKQPKSAAELKKEARITIMEMLYPPPPHPQNAFDDFEAVFAAHDENDSGMVDAVKLTTCLVDVCRKLITASNEAAMNDDNSTVESRKNERTDTTNLFQNVEDVSENIANVVFRLLKSDGAEEGADVVEADNPAASVRFEGKVEFTFAQVAPMLQSREVSEVVARTLSIDDVFGVEERVTIEEVRTDLMKMVFKPELQGLGKKRSNGILTEMYRKYDVDEGGELSPAELSAFFVDLSTNLLSHAEDRSDTTKAVITRHIEDFADAATEAAFEQIDVDESGGISVQELIPAIRSGALMAILAKAMGLDPEEIRRREDRKAPLDPLLASTTEKLKGMKAPINAGALKASMVGTGSRFGSTTSRNIPVIGDPGKLAPTLGGEEEDAGTILYSPSKEGGTFGGGAATVATAASRSAMSKKLLKKKAEPRPNPVSFTCNLLSAIDKPLPVNDHISVPLLHSELLKMPTLVHNEREGTGFFPGALDMGAAEGFVERLKSILKLFNQCEGISAQLQTFGGQVIVNQVASKEKVMAVRLAANQRESRRTLARKRADVKSLMRVETVASRWMPDFKYSTFSISGKSGNLKPDYTKPSRKIMNGWRKKEEEYDDDVYDQFEPDNSATHAKLAKLVVKAAISKDDILRAFSRPDTTFKYTHMLVITADEPMALARFLDSDLYVIEWAELTAPLLQQEKCSRPLKCRAPISRSLFAVPAFVKSVAELRTKIGAETTKAAGEMLREQQRATSEAESMTSAMSFLRGDGFGDSGSVDAETLTLPSALEGMKPMAVPPPIVVRRRVPSNPRGAAERASVVSSRFMSHRCRRLRDDLPDPFQFLAPLMTQPLNINMTAGAPPETSFPLAHLTATFSDGTTLELGEQDAFNAQRNPTVAMDPLLQWCRDHVANTHRPPLPPAFQFGGDSEFGGSLAASATSLPESKKHGWDVAIGAGSISSCELVFQLLCDPGGRDSVLVEEYSSTATLDCLASLNVKTIPVAMDDGGIIPSELRRVLDECHQQVFGRPLHVAEPGFASTKPFVEGPSKPTCETLDTHPLEGFFDGVSMPKSIGGRGTRFEPQSGKRMPKALYTMPVGQNPTGSRLAAHRYAEIYQICRDYGIMIIEDDAYFYLQHGADRAREVDLWKAERRARLAEGQSQMNDYMSTVASVNKGEGASPVRDEGRSVLSATTGKSEAVNTMQMLDDYGRIIDTMQSVDVPANPNPSVTSPGGGQEPQLSLDAHTFEDDLAAEDSLEADVNMRMELEGLYLGNSFLSIDEDGRVVRLDTFSNILAPGFRISWLTATAPLVAAYNSLANCSSQAGCSLSMVILGRTLHAWEEEKHGLMGDDKSLAGMESAVTMQSATNSPFLLRSPSRGSRSVFKSPLLAFQLPSPGSPTAQPQQPQQPQNDAEDQQQYQSVADTAFYNPGPISGFERQVLKAQGILRTQCLKLVAAVEQHLSWAVTFTIPAAGMFLWIKLKSGRIENVRNIPGLTQEERDSIKISDHFRLHDFPHDEHKMTEAMARFEVIALPGHVCAPNRGVGSVGSPGRETKSRLELPVYRCLRLSYVADPSYYEQAVLRLKQLIFELCVPKKPGHDTESLHGDMAPGSPLRF